MTQASDFTRIRPGLYQTTDQRFTVEKLDQLAERYPGDDYFNQWRVTEGSEVWLVHFGTLKEAKGAVKAMGYGEFKEGD